MEIEAQAGVPETPDQLAARRVAAVEAWRRALAPAKQWQEYERNMRQTVTELCFPTPIKGTQRFEIGGGYKLKLVYGTTYTLGDKELIDPVLQEKVPIDVQVKATLDAIASLGGEGPLLAEKLVKWKPELSEPAYKALRAEVPIEAEAKRLIDAILTTKPASPQLTVEEPKVKP